MSVRFAVPDDLERIVEIENQNFTTNILTKRTLKRHIITSNGILFVKEHLGKIAGYAIILFRKNSQKARLYSIVIDKPFRNMNFGKELLFAAEYIAWAQGTTSMRLEVRADNEKAINIYKNAGYKVFGLHTNYYEDGVDALRMEKDLHEI